MGRRSVLARFPARLPELFCHHRVCVQARCKRDWRRVGHRVVVPASERTPSDAEATTSASGSSRSRLQRLAHRPCRRARGDGRPHVLPSRVRLTPGRFVLPTTTTAPLARASPRPDATRSRQPRAARLSLPEPSFARLTALPFPPAGTRSRFLRTGREEDKRADDALTGRRLHRGSRVFLVIRCSTTPARAVALPAVTRASSLPA